jgi:four helix bundle protein
MARPITGVVLPKLISGELRDSESAGGQEGLVMDEGGRRGRDPGKAGSRREPLIPKHGGYRNLKSFQVAQLVYDVTARFCDRFIDRRSRTHDQMTQAARSGVQNIAEGSQASGTSKKFELKLTNVARASLEELRLDYEDFLRQRNLNLWGRQDPRRQALIDRRPRTADDVAWWVKEVCSPQEGGQSGPSGRSGQSGQPDKAAQSEAFENEGGFTERLYHTRKKRRQER